MKEGGGSCNWKTWAKIKLELCLFCVIFDFRLLRDEVLPDIREKLSEEEFAQAIWSQDGSRVHQV